MKTWSHGSFPHGPRKFLRQLSKVPAKKSQSKKTHPWSICMQLKFFRSHIEYFDLSSPSVQKAAIVSLNNCLDFVSVHFDNENERNYLMQVVVEATQCSNDGVAISAFECLVSIMTLYYKYMTPYMTHFLFTMTIESMKSSNDSIVLQAIEFWSTVCDEEISRQIQIEDEPEVLFFYFAKTAAPHVIPTLLTLLTRQESEDDSDDEWTVAKAAATCLSLFANCVQDDILTQNNVIFSFIERNISDAHNWRAREAAVMAFGSILDGPRPDLTFSYVQQALPLLLTMVCGDNSVPVQDTSAWAISRVCEIVVSSKITALSSSEIPSMVLKAVLTGLNLAPRVAVHCANVNVHICTVMPNMITQDNICGCICIILIAVCYAK